MDSEDDIKAILHRISEIDRKLASQSYSQSDPGAMMDRRMLRKERDKLEIIINTYINKKGVV